MGTADSPASNGHSLQLDGCDIRYPQQVKSIKAKNIFKTKVLHDNPETLVGDFTSKDNRKRNITAPQTPPHKDVPQSPTITAQMDHMPKLTSSVRTLKEGLSVLKQEFIDFKERTLSVLHQNNNIQPAGELYSLLKQQRDKIRELQQAMRELEEHNQYLRTALVTEELTTITHVSITSTQILQHNQTEEQPQTKNGLTSSPTLTPAITPPLIQPSHSTLPTSFSSSSTASTLPETTLTKPIQTPTTDLHNTVKPAHNTQRPPPSEKKQHQVIFMSDSNGKYVDMKRLFPNKNSTKIWTPTISKATDQLSSMDQEGVLVWKRGDSLARFTYCSVLGSSVVDYTITNMNPGHINAFTVLPQLHLSDHSPTVL
ncbi:hypothetical protein MHYP_G00364070 [Metynnis hypsauchen]